MEVQCERCKTSYDFDDALVSARGTTVKCTSCGHQFKVRRETASESDRWTVRTIEGREHLFTSIGELRRAIVSRQVGRADTLTRGNDPPRALGAIAGLEPFFDEVPAEKGSGARTSPEAPRARAASQPGIGARGAKTMVGHGQTSGSQPGAKMPSNRPPAPLGGRQAPSLRPMPTPTPPPQGTYAPSEPMRPRVDTIRPPGAVPPPLPSTQPRPLDPSEDSGMGAIPAAPVSVAPVLTLGDSLAPDSSEPIEPDPETLERPGPRSPFQLASTPPPPPVVAKTSGAPPAAKTIQTAPPQLAPNAPMRAPLSHPPIATGVATSNRPPPPTINPFPETSSPLPPPTNPVRVENDPMRSAFSSMDDVSGDIALPGRPRRLGGWLVAIVLIGGVSVLGFGIAKPYLAARGAAAQAAPPLDARAQQFLVDGERAMTTGDLEAANDDFTKASALAEKDPRVLGDVAKLAAARADVPWLDTKLVPADLVDEVKTTKAALDELSARANRAADAAVAAAPDDRGAILAKIDALRIAGDSAGARGLVTKVVASASEPDVAYSLAALDLADAEPLWPMVLDRLHVAAAGEGSEGRARAALVYAMARSGDVQGAKAELDKLASAARPYPLVGRLRVFLSKTQEKAAKVDAGSPNPPNPKMSGMTAATATVDVTALPHPAAARGGGGGGGDQASGGGGGRASTDPRILLQQAETAKTAHDFDRARGLYTMALSSNPNDSEALAGLGDVARGQHDIATAADYYKRALAVNPVYLPALVGLGDCEWESGDKDEAQKTYRDVMDRFPEGTYPARVSQRANASTSAVPPTPTSAPAPSDTGGASP